jgi:uncharacterized protein YcfL
MTKSILRHSLLASLLAASCGLCACNTANTTQSGQGRFGSNVAYDRIVSNCWLNYKANVLGVREGTVSDNIKKITVDVYSDQATTQRFSYRFEWFDAAGTSIASPTSTMTSVTIQPRETIAVTGVAPTPSATQWRLTFLDEQR